MKNIKKITYFISFVFGSFFIQAQNKQLIKLWQTSATLKTPESVILDRGSATLYFSNIDGQPDAKDKQGSIGKINSDGTSLVIDWIKGLNAPKGLALYKNLLYVADLDEIVTIDVKSSKIIQHTPVNGAKFLNDVCVDAKGVIYVSDMHTNKVHRIENGKVTTFLENQPGVNGVYFMGDELFLLENGALIKSDRSKHITKITDGIEPSTDGLAITEDKEYIVSCWTGIIYVVRADGTKYQVLNTQEQSINTADIFYDSVSKTLYVPTFFANKIVAYRLE